MKRDIIKYVAMALVMVLVFGILLLGVRRIRQYQAEKVLEELADEMTGVDAETADGTEDILIDFDKLQEQNSDIYAWILIPGTQVNDPILQSTEEEEDFYLMHNLDQSRGYPGCIYTQTRNSRDFTDRNTVIYGHNMKDGSMFASLHNYEEEGFLEEHPFVYIYTPESKLTYQIFAVYNAGNVNLLDYYGNFEDVTAYQQYLTEIQSQYGEDGACIDTSVAVDASDRIITLSTCLGVETERFLVQAVLINETGTEEVLSQ